MISPQGLIVLRPPFRSLIVVWLFAFAGITEGVCEHGELRTLEHRTIVMSGGGEASFCKCEDGKCPVEFAAGNPQDLGIAEFVPCFTSVSGADTANFSVDASANGAFETNCRTSTNVRYAALSAMGNASAVRQTAVSQNFQEIDDLLSVPSGIISFISIASVELACYSTDLRDSQPRWGSSPSSTDQNQTLKKRNACATTPAWLRRAMINVITAVCGQAA